MTSHLEKATFGGELLPGIDQRDYQLECVRILAHERSNGRSSALIHMATGLGKTVVMALDLHQFLREQPDARVLFLSHRDEINRQTMHFFESALEQHNIEGHLFKGSAIPDNLHAIPFIFSTFQAMHKDDPDSGRVRELFNPYDFDYVIVDESHHAQADTFKETIEYFQPQFLLGATATPNRNDGKSIYDIFGGTEVFKKTLADGINERILAEPYYIAAIPEDTVGALEQEVLEGSAPETTLRFGAEAIVNDYLNRLQKYLTNPKTLFFCNSIQEAEEYMSLLPDSAAIHSELKTKERRSILDRFKSGELRTLVSIDIMNEGVNVPDIDSIVFARSTESETTFLQQLGRGLRRTATKDRVYVFDYVANHERLKMLSRFMASLDRDDPIDRDAQPDDEASEQDTLNEITASVVSKPTGTFEFDEHILDIAELLKERQALLEEASKWNRERSIETYKDICRRLGGIATLSDIDSSIGERDRMFLLWPFRNRLIDLKREAGVKFIDQFPEMVGVSSFCDKNAIGISSFLNLAKQYGIALTMLAGNDGRPIKSMLVEDAERISRILKLRPSKDRKDTIVHIDRRFEVTDYAEDQLPDGYMTIDELIEQNGWLIDRSALYQVAYYGDISIERYLTYTKGNRMKRLDCITEYEADVLGYMINQLAHADDTQVTLTGLARLINIDEQETLRLLKKAGLGGEPRISSSSQRIALHYDRSTATKLNELR